MAMDGIKDRLLSFIQSQNMSVAKFERITGLSNGYVSSIKKSISVDKLENILSAFPNLNKEWVVSGKGYMTEDQETENYPIRQTADTSSASVRDNKPLIMALCEVTEMRKLLSEVIFINKEQSNRLLNIVDKLADRI